jgi:hypothetical protein
MKRFNPALLIEALRKENAFPPPKGWMTVEQIRQELNLAHARNASSRACDLTRRGVLERMPHQFKAKTGQCHRAYVYRPVPPYRTITEAAACLYSHNEDPVRRLGLVSSISPSSCASPMSPSVAVSPGQD